MTSETYPKGEQPDKAPDWTVALATSILLPAALIAMCFAIGIDEIGWALSVLVVLLVVAGIVWRPLRSGLTLAIVSLVPIWGLVARLDRIATCKALRTAKIYTDPDSTHVIPATTWKMDGDTFVRFDGGGQPGMAPEHIKELLQQNARVWRCRSFAISEDAQNPGLITMQLSRRPAVRTVLDRPLTGVVA